MNINIFLLSDNILMGKMPCPNNIEKLAIKKGFFINKKMVFPSFFSQLESAFASEQKNTINIIICEKHKARVNEAIASVLSDEIKENINLKKTVLDFYRQVNLPVEKQAFSEWEIPSKARGIICEGEMQQGYFIKDDNSSFIVLSLSNYAQMLEVVLDEIKNNDFVTHTLKTFGLKEENIHELLKEKSKNKDGIKISMFSDGLDVDVTLRARQDNEKVEEYIAFALKKLSRFVYAEDQISIYNTVFDLLTLTKQKIAIAESITGGNIASSLIKNNKGASKMIEKGFVTYSDQAKIDVLGVKELTLKHKTAVSSEVAYEMAEGLLRVTDADVVLATTGYADGERGGECFIALGDREKINVYKNIFSGSREEVINAVTKSSLFYLIKKFRSNNFIFS
jgi:nicotinamide-nucleotide amidase